MGDSRAITGNTTFVWPDNSAAMSHWTEQLFSEHPDLFQPVFEESVDRGDEHVDAILSLLADLYDFRPASVLDVGCGIGRHVTAFADRGIDAHGIDLGADYIEQAEARAEAAGVDENTAFYDLDMRALDDLGGRYDLVMNVYSFEFFDEKTNQGLLERFRDLLNPEGVLLLKIFNKDGRLIEFTDGAVKSVEGVTYAVSREYDPLTSRRRSEGYVLENGSVVGDYEFDVRLYSPVEMKELLASTGFEDIHLFKTFDREELTRDSEKQVVLGRT